MRNIIHKLAISVSLFILISCEGKFVPDPIDPRIPKYSKKGYDVAGALVNGNPWVAVKECPLFGGCSQILRVVQLNEQWIFAIDGIMTTPEGNRGLHIEFVIDSAEFGELAQLDNRIVVLDGVRNFGRLRGFEECLNLESRVGQVFFRSVRITQNDTNVSLAISGTFGFMTDSPDCDRVEVFQGRFDYSIIQ